MLVNLVLLSGSDDGRLIRGPNPKFILGIWDFIQQYIPGRDDGYDEVYILYRRIRKEMPVGPWEIDYSAASSAIQKTAFSISINKEATGCV